MILNMTGGGGGSNKSQIIVTAPSGSTVTCSKGSVTKTASEKSGTWTFRGLDLGTWKVMWEWNGKSKTQNVPIERLSIEYVEFTAAVYLIDGSPVNDDVTGGWIAEGKQLSNESTLDKKAPTVTQHDGYIELSHSGGYSGWYRTSSPIDLTNISRIVLDGFLSTSYEGRESQSILACYDTDPETITTDIPTYWGTKSSSTVASMLAEYNANNDAVSGVRELDVSGLSGEHYIAFGLHNKYPLIHVNALYLEE